MYAILRALLFLKKQIDNERMLNMKKIIFALIIVVMWTPSILAEIHNRTVKCRGMTATIVGTDGDDRIKGTPGDDIIHGLGGDDDIEEPEAETQEQKVADTTQLPTPPNSPDKHRTPT